MLSSELRLREVMLRYAENTAKLSRMSASRMSRFFNQRVIQELQVCITEDARTMNEMVYGRVSD